MKIITKKILLSFKQIQQQFIMQSFLKQLCHKNFMSSNLNQNQGESQIKAQNQQSNSINLNDPLGPSYPQSAAQYLVYRIGIVVLAGVLIVVGKSNLPTDSVECIQDVVLDTLSSITNFFRDNQVFGRIIITFLHLFVDIQLLGMLIFWIIKGDSFRYPLSLAILGITKILLNIVFQTRTIVNSFTSPGYIPSIVFGQNFQNMYFFSGVTALMMINTCEFYKLGYKRIWKIQALLMIIVAFALLAFKLNFLMDVLTAMVFGHMVHRIMLENQAILNKRIMIGYKWVLKRINKDEQQQKRQAGQQGMRQQ